MLGQGELVVRDLVGRALDLARVQGATYADVRFQRRERQFIVVQNGNVEALSLSDHEGLGVRVLIDGAWGFASTSRTTGPHLERATALAVRVARASARVTSQPVRLGAPVVSVGTYRTPIQKDPFAISLEHKIELLLAADAAMREVKGVGVTMATIELIREHKVFASTEGSYVEQDLIETGAGIEATAIGNGEVQKRSYPNSFGRQQGMTGYELVESLDLIGNAPAIAEQAVALLSAEQCPTDIHTTVVLDSTQTALQLHESCGHAIELDRVLGMEASYAGTSFLTLDKLGSYQFGSECVTVTADGTLPGGLGTFGFDDEGVPAQRTVLVDRGRFAGYLSSRETAATIDQPSSGSMRADGWNRIPLIRMTNVSLEPGDWTFEDLVADTEDGIYMQTNRSWSIDDRRLNFQFGAEIAWRIENGKLGAMLKNPTYTGMTPHFWANCDAVCNRDHWQIWGTVNCAKGQPPQLAHVGHGTSPARFRDVRVGLLR